MEHNWMYGSLVNKGIYDPGEIINVVLMGFNDFIQLAMSDDFAITYIRDYVQKVNKNPEQLEKFK